MSIEPIRRAKISEQVATQLRDAILNGRFRPGESLPGERDLAARFDVNRSSVREAIHRLEAWGLVEVRHGGATLVRDFLVSAGLQLLPHLIAPGGQVDPRMLRDLLDLRVMLLGWTAAQAARRATPAEVAGLRRSLDRLASAADPRRMIGAAAVQEADYAFFEALVAVADNRVLTLFAGAIRAVYQENQALFAAIYSDPFDLDDHRRAVDAIAAGDAVTAEAAMAAYGRRPLAQWDAVFGEGR
jgi:DNA-binding FadR family transcriptional regulator